MGGRWSRRRASTRSLGSRTGSSNRSTFCVCQTWMIWSHGWKPSSPGRKSGHGSRREISAPTGDAPLNRRVIEEISRVLMDRVSGDMASGCTVAACTRSGTNMATASRRSAINTASGYGHCYLCGTMLAKEVCARLNIDPVQLGGLVEKPEPPVMPLRSKPGATNAQPPDAPPTVSSTARRNCLIGWNDISPGRARRAIKPR